MKIYLLQLSSTYHNHCFIVVMDSEKVDKRGYAYECLQYGRYQVERRYVEAHIYKVHLSPSEVPFYCSMCNFISRTEKDLNRHMKGYKPHKDAVAALTRQGLPIPDTSSIFVSNSNHRPIDGTLMQRLSLTVTFVL